MNPNQKVELFYTDRDLYSSPVSKQVQILKSKSNIFQSPNALKPKQQFFETQNFIQQKPPVPAILTANQNKTMNRLSLRTQNTIKDENKLSIAIEVESSIKELKDRINKIGKTLYQHQRILSDMRGSKLSASTTSNSTVSEVSTPIGQTLFQISKIIQQELEFQRHNSQIRVSSAIDDIRREINERFARREDYQQNFLNQVKDIRNKLYEGDKMVLDSLRMEIDSLKLINNQTSRSLNSKVEKEILNVRDQIEVIKIKFETFISHFDEKHKTFLTSNKRFDSPQLFRYRETLQLISKDFDPIKEDVTIQQTIYHVDKQGYLLDQNNFYLVDQNNNFIKLQQRHLSILSSLNMIC